MICVLRNSTYLSNDLDFFSYLRTFFLLFQGIYVHGSLFVVVIHVFLSCLNLITQWVIEEGRLVCY